MIEAPEARCLAEQVNDLLRGKQIILAIPNYTPHKFTFYSGDTSLFEERLLNRAISEANSRGGMLEIRAEDTLLVFTDGANIRYYAPGEKLPPKYQMLIGFNDESCIIVSVRMYGGIFCLPVDWRNDPSGCFKNSLNKYYEAAISKPQVLSDGFNRAYFLGLTEPEEIQKKSTKAFLATDQTIPGLGNGVLQDILYNAQIHPKKKVKDLSLAQKNKLFDCLKNTLQDMYEQKGRNTESDLLGNKGKYIPWLSKNTAGQPCTRCDEIIQKENYMGGSIYYCPGCQEL